MHDSAIFTELRKEKAFIKSVNIVSSNCRKYLLWRALDKCLYLELLLILINFRLCL